MELWFPWVHSSHTDFGYEYWHNYSDISYYFYGSTQQMPVLIDEFSQQQIFLVNNESWALESSPCSSSRSLIVPSSCRVFFPWDASERLQQESFRAVCVHYTCLVHCSAVPLIRSVSLFSLLLMQQTILLPAGCLSHREELGGKNK